MPKEVAWRKKQAAQYGSKFDRAIFRLAHADKFKYKKDYLKSLVLDPSIKWEGLVFKNKYNKDYLKSL